MSEPRGASVRLEPAESLNAAVDEQFARLMMSIAEAPSPVLEQRAREVSKATRERNVCIDIAAVERRALIGSGVVGVPEEPNKPLVLDGKNRLYMNRYWQYEQATARKILERIKGEDNSGRKAAIAKRLDEYFPKAGAAQNADQRSAAEFALRHRLCIITGGPGTGKTTTVAVILALLIEFAKKDHLLISLAAPTGKAAARLQESIIGQKQKLPIPAPVKEKIPEDAGTIHRLLGTRYGTPYFRHDAEHPLVADVIVLDECSMIDAALMAKFMNAVGPETQLIMLGDKDQLSSVEAGAVFSDLCNAGLPCVKQLAHSYRFGSASGIGALSRAVNDGDADRAVAVLSGGYPDIGWEAFQGPDEYARALDARLLTGYRAYLESATIDEAFTRLREFKILCAVREGPYGVAGVNRAAEDVFVREGLIGNKTGMWYRGRPLMITENDYGLSLFNGDVGIIWPDADEGGMLMAFFEGGEKGLRKIHPSMLPPHETVFAMTVHKSQGSQFGHVLTILPPEESAVVTRELLYTALTRAESAVQLWAPEKILRQAAARRTVRHSGLCDTLEAGMKT
jgi:exodeoxyribonuclease V alpha subunit